MIKQKHDRLAALLLTGALSALAGFGAGYTVAQDAQSPQSQETAQAPQDTDTQKQPDSAHKHAEILNVVTDKAPRVSLTIAKDSLSGWNITLHTKHFRFAPENANGTHVLGEGHAHLYVDGKKVARLYGPNFHYDQNFEGAKTFKVTLNANDHREYAVDGQIISAEQRVSTGHDHSSHSH